MPRDLKRRRPIKRTSTTAVAALAALAWLPASVPASAQETTAQEVLEALRLGERVESAPGWMDVREVASGSSARWTHRR
ncbi:MAG: hypothetical protein OXG18_07880 [Gemmatimonadetes bacterium]|nr:hypothetical protein [Gemmatimonadota bacterium]